MATNMCASWTTCILELSAMQRHTDHAGRAHLWVAKIQDLIKQFVNQHEIAFDALLTELASKVVLEQCNYLQETLGCFKGSIFKSQRVAAASQV